MGEDERMMRETESVYSIAFDSIDIDDHIHCAYCFCINCHYNRCALRSCPECHAILHGCKLEDHLLICAKVRSFLFQNIKIINWKLKYFFRQLI